MRFSCEYQLLLQELDTRYRNCLEKFIEEFVDLNKDNLRGIILFGGLVRDRKGIPGWSDIDLAVIYQDITARNIFQNSKVKRECEEKYQIRIDLNEIAESEISKDMMSIRYNSELTNALAFRNNVSVSVFENPPVYTFSLEEEKRTAIYYINDTLLKYRKFLNENDFFEEDGKKFLQRIVRWTFSIIRASLRLDGIYAHPYEESISFLQKLYPDLDTSCLQKIAKARKNGELLKTDSESLPQLILDIDKTMDNFVSLLNKRWCHE